MREELKKRGPREEKVKEVDELAEKMQASGGMLFTDYRGLSVKSMATLRAALKEKGAVCLVAKNTMLRLAADKAKAEGLKPWLEGPTATIFMGEDVVSPSKSLVDFIKEHANLPVIKGALVEGRLLDAAAVKQLADLPSREVLLATLVMTLQSPLSSLLATLQAPMVQLAGTLQSLAEQKSA